MKVYVLFDVVGWSTEIKGRPDRRDFHAARRGEVIDVSAEEAERLIGLGAVSENASDLEGAVAAGSEPPSWDDAQLDSANIDDTVAYLAQHPSEARRVLEVETSRPDRDLKTRKGIIEAAERVQAAYEEQLAADAAAREEAEANEQRASLAGAGAAPGAPRIP